MGRDRSRKPKAGREKIIESGPGDRKLLELRRQLLELERLQIPPDELEKRVLDLMEQVMKIEPGSLL